MTATGAWRSSTSGRTRSAWSCSPGASAAATAGGGGRTRSTRRCASAPGSTRPGSCSPSRWSGRSRRSTCSPTSAARRGSTTCARSRPRRSATRPTRRTSWRRPASARGWRSRCSRREEEARYGYLAAVNSTTLSDGVALDLGGGSMQLTYVADRHARDARSWPLGAVRMTERFLAGEKVKGKQLKALRAHIGDELADGGLAQRRGHGRRAARGHRRHGAQPRGGGGDRGRPAVVRRPGLRAHAQGARRPGRPLRRPEPARSAARSRASSPSAGT